ncbi:MAG: Gfo/Idh/MocA family oxidoreductase [Cyclobacteriaceae bacterium]|nr:MAG: Gfo/Idh/MocA family oxidoreductase [Cyclobacteriaceae bacterium]
MKRIRWGILGCGRIARKFASDLRLVGEAELVAVAARELTTAQAFAKEFPAKHLHGSYQDLVNNPEVDVIYVATPHALHHAHVLLCLQHKKAVLCEKAFAINYKQAHEMVALAKAQDTFLMEAFWTRFLPHYEKAKQLLTEGKVGEIRYFYGEFGFKPVDPVPPRLFDPALGGGALLDIGVYPVFMALDLLGKPDVIDAAMTPAPTGIDEQCVVRFQYKNGAIANLFCTLASNLASGGDIGGTKGRIRFTHRMHGPTSLLEYYSGAVDTRQLVATEQAKGNGYEYEIRHVNECLQNNLKASPILTHEFTLLLMQTLDVIRAKAGIRYAVD